MSFIDSPFIATDNNTSFSSYNRDFFRSVGLMVLRVTMRSPYTPISSSNLSSLFDHSLMKPLPGLKIVSYNYDKCTSDHGQSIPTMEYSISQPLPPLGSLASGWGGSD